MDLSIPPKFLLCDDPRDDHEREYILHTGKPYILAEIIIFLPSDQEHFDEFIEQADLAVSFEFMEDKIVLDVVQFDDEFDEQECIELLKEMCIWYQSYLLWENDNLINDISRMN